jgi:hypothetical protein
MYVVYVDTVVDVAYSGVTYINLSLANNVEVKCKTTKKQSYVTSCKLTMI